MSNWARGSANRTRFCEGSLASDVYFFRLVADGGRLHLHIIALRAASVVLRTGSLKASSPSPFTLLSCSPRFLTFVASRNVFFRRRSLSVQRAFVSSGFLGGKAMS